MSLRNNWAASGLAALLLLAPAVHAEDAAEKQSVEELRNTVINLLQALVDKGLLTREQAQRVIAARIAKYGENSSNVGNGPLAPI